MYHAKEGAEGTTRPGAEPSPKGKKKMILSARLNRLGLLKILLSVVYIGIGLVLVALIIGTREVPSEVYGASLSFRTLARGDLVVDNPSREGLGGVLGVLLMILNTDDRCTNSISVRHLLFSRIRVQCKPQSKVKRPRYIGFEKMGAQPPLVRLTRYIHSDTPKQGDHRGGDRPTRGAINDGTEGGGEGGLGDVVRKDISTTLTYGSLEMLEEVKGGKG